jgi:glycosyltransferase involved in cell wall biosynthesis
MGVSGENISVVANYVNSKIFLTPNINPQITQKFKNNFVVLYSGGFDLHRGLETLIKALPLVINRIPEIKLVLVGDGRNMNDLKELASKLKVSKFVSFEGWQPIDLFPSYISASHVDVIPHLKTVHTDNTIPHKLFHYMIFGKAVLVSDCDPLKRIVDETNTGMVFKSNNEKELASSLQYLYDHPNDVSQMGENGKTAVAEKYNWDSTAQNLIKLYSNIAENICSQS